ncbi:MAG: hypothetical protein ACQEWA_02935 [Sphaerochaetaceae bacterium]
MDRKAELIEMLDDLFGEGTEERASVEEIREALDAPRLEDLKHGDLIVHKKGKDGKFFYKCEDNPIVFDRYLTEQEQAILFASGNPSKGRYEFDCLVSEGVRRGGLPDTFVIDSRVFEKV